MPWPHLSNWPSPLVSSQVIGARCQVLLLVGKKSQVPIVTSGRKSTQHQVVLDLSLARVIVLQLSAACASPGFLNCHTLSVFGQHRGNSVKIAGTETETATRHFRCLTSAVFYGVLSNYQWWGAMQQWVLQKEGLRFNNTGNERGAHARGNITS